MTWCCFIRGLHLKRFDPSRLLVDLSLRWILLVLWKKIYVSELCIEKFYGNVSWEYLVVLWVFVESSFHGMVDRSNWSKTLGCSASVILVKVKFCSIQPLDLAQSTMPQTRRCALWATTKLHVCSIFMLNAM